MWQPPFQVIQNLVWVYFETLCHWHSLPCQWIGISSTKNHNLWYSEANLKYPLLYWRYTQASEPLSLTAASGVREYLKKSCDSDISYIAIYSGIDMDHLKVLVILQPYGGVAQWQRSSPVIGTNCQWTNTSNAKTTTCQIVNENIA